ncbi:histidinol-phosphate transaminase [Micromonospora globispora]|uniref:Aromatic amino acid aminotransferase n=1 Tax=Micromonospora globispora TaxID=1450148 RepID=A0A317K2J1_9ACTN|nr:histidinol-phosphate transaminase [Micromonospora globispora]PWU46534.1 histidinol-phosphate transaminase [Micromonospora globispora]PWU54726.1 histidinol-phosphate transaminase [Micromonospora globispora]RQX08170.1 histidinol-phosphate transaminase [Micromonospora globispora]
MTERQQPPVRLTRADLDALPNYVPGRSPADLARELGLPEAIKLASNEVPYGPLPGVVEAVTEAVAGSHRYPDMGVVALRQALAERYGVDADRIATGCGSVALAEHLVRATCLPGDELLYSWRSFEAYPIIAATSGATSVRVPNDAGHGHDLASMVAAVTDRTRMILVCNPNNPTGTAVRKAELDRFLDALPDDVLVVIDEAYREFVTDPEVPDGLTYLDRPNVAVLRTLSKAWGLAGLRIGWLVAEPTVAAAVRKVVTPFSTSMAAQAGALAALAQADEVERRCALVVAERERVTEALRKIVPDVPSSQANFVWLPLGDRAVEFGKACEARGVIVRPFPGDGVRVTIGTPEENDAFLAAAEPALA